MPERKNASGIGRAPFAYATIRVVPRVEREEFVNVGVVLYSRPRKYLGVQARLDVDRLRALARARPRCRARQLDVIRLVVAGDPAGGAIALLPAAERFGWLSAPASTVVQPGPVHAGLAADPEAPCMSSLRIWPVRLPHAEGQPAWHLALLRHAAHLRHHPLHLFKLFEKLFHLLDRGAASLAMRTVRRRPITSGLRRSSGSWSR